MNDCQMLNAFFTVSRNKSSVVNQDPLYPVLLAPHFGEVEEEAGEEGGNV